VVKSASTGNRAAALGLGKELLRQGARYVFPKQIPAREMGSFRPPNAYAYSSLKVYID